LDKQVKYRDANAIKLNAQLAYFFSSRRRHTSSLRDWSSDVCSSDLNRINIRNIFCRDSFARPSVCRSVNFFDSAVERGRNRVPRSEERRVGKECISKGCRYDYKDKIGQLSVDRVADR